MQHQSHVQRDRAAEAARKAQELIVFCDGLEQAGYETYAHRARWVARETFWLAEQLHVERAARESLIAERDRLMALRTGGAAA